MSTDDRALTRRRPQPYVLPIAIGLGFAAVVAISGIAATVNQWHDESDVHRVVFINVPSAWKAVFYTVLPVLFVYGAVQFSQRVRNWQRGAPDDRSTTRRNVAKRLADFRSGVYMQTLLRDPAAGVMHSLIYFNFIVLAAVTTVLEIDHQLPEGAKFLHGRTYQAYSLVGDVAGLLFVVGMVWAIVRRYVQRPYRIRIKSKPEHALILGTFLVLGVTGFVAEVFRIALEGRPDFEKWSFVGYPLSGLVDGWDSLAGWHQAVWLVHVLCFFLFLLILPVTMLRHMFTSPLNMYLRDRERPKGAMKAMPNLMETELETFGASTVEDFTWKQLLDTDACTMCGRCTSVCPAHATGKPLDPREIVLKTGEVMAATGSPVVSPPIGVDPEITISADSLFDRITPEEVWACTSCKACDEICPVNIEILDKILDMRRYLSLMESNFPTELGTAYRSMENSANPWGLSQSERAAWAAKVPGVPIVEPGDSLRPRVPVLGGLRRLVRRQEPQGERGHGQAHAAGGDRLRHPRPVRELHGRPGPALGQRVPLPDAGHAEHRDPRRHGRAPRSSPSARTASTRWPTSTRSSAASTRSCTTASCWSGSSPRASSTSATPGWRSGSCTTTPATWVATTTCTWRPAR